MSELRREENQMWSLICGIRNKCDKLMERGKNTSLAWRAGITLFHWKWHHWTFCESSVWNCSGRLWSYRVVHFFTQTSMIYFEITNIFQELKVIPSCGSQLVTGIFMGQSWSHLCNKDRVSASTACWVVWGLSCSGQTWGPPRLRADGKGISVMPRGL